LSLAKTIKPVLILPIVNLPDQLGIPDFDILPPNLPSSYYCCWSHRKSFCPL